MPEAMRLMVRTPAAPKGPKSMGQAVANLAADAAERSGRGSGRPAWLNSGDCLCYAAARHLDAALLFKGDDFVHTDVRSAVAA